MRFNPKVTLVLIVILILLIIYTLWIGYQGNQYEMNVENVLGHHMTEQSQADQSAPRKNTFQTLKKLKQYSSSFNIKNYPDEKGLISWDDPRIVMQYLDIYNLSEPARDGEYQCVKMKTKPPTPIFGSLKCFMIVWMY